MTTAKERALNANASGGVRAPKSRLLTLLGRGLITRAYEIWERKGRPTGREQEHWDQAVQEIEGEGPQPERGPVVPDPTVSAG